MKLNKFYKEYIKCYLNDPEKPKYKYIFLACVFLCMILVSSMLLLPSNSYLHTSILCILSINFIFTSFYFGYLGLSITLLICSANIFRFILMFINFKHDSDFFALSFLLTIEVASIFLSFLAEKERAKQKKLEWMSIVDGLTEAYNQRYFQLRLEQEMDHAEKNSSSLGLLMVDIDNFKKFNDSNGYIIGDLILKKTVEFLRSKTNLNDILFRYGGDEFIIIVPNIDKNNSIAIIEELSKSFQDIKGYIRNLDPSYYLTISAGYSIYPELASSKEKLLMQAENALHYAKNSGRNRVHLFHDTFKDINSNLEISNRKFVSSLKVLLSTILAKDKYTLAHSERVSEYAMIIARSLNLSEDEIHKIQISGILHDIGKIHIPENILNNRETLTDVEMQIIKEHTTYGVSILEEVPDLAYVIPVVKYHHERFDGNGYPDKLVGEAIPFEARLLCIADSLDAMLSNRAYSNGITIPQAMEELKKCSGAQFDPKIVDAFISYLEKNQSTNFDVHLKSDSSKSK